MIQGLMLLALFVFIRASMGKNAYARKGAWTGLKDEKGEERNKLGKLKE